MKFDLKKTKEKESYIRQYSFFVSQICALVMLNNVSTVFIFLFDTNILRKKNKQKLNDNKNMNSNSRLKRLARLHITCWSHSKLPISYLEQKKNSALKLV